MYMLEEGREPYNNEINMLADVTEHSNANRAKLQSQVDNPDNKMIPYLDDTHD